MSANPSSNITQLLIAHKDGERAAFDRLTGLIYGDLRRIARRQLGGNSDRTLCTTMLVNEAWLKLVDYDQVSWEGRAQFFAAAARCMHRIIIDRARAVAAQKRGGGQQPVTLYEERIAVDAQAAELLALEQALLRLGEVNERLAQVVECMYFGGLTAPETATALGVSTRTVERDWARARVWLQRALRE